MPGEFAALPLQDAFPWVLPSSQGSLLHPALVSSLQAEALVGPVPTSPEKAESHKKTHGIFLIVLIAWQVETCRQSGKKKPAGWKKKPAGWKKASWVHPALLSASKADPDQTLPRALLPAAHKLHPKTTVSTALGRFPCLEAERAFPFGLRVLGSARRPLGRFPHLWHKRSWWAQPLELLSLLFQLCKLCLGGEPRHSRGQGRVLASVPHPSPCQCDRIVPLPWMDCASSTPIRCQPHLFPARGAVPLQASRCVGCCVLGSVGEPRALLHAGISATSPCQQLGLTGLTALPN